VGEVPHVTLTEKTFRISPAGSQPMPSTISVPGYSGSYPGNFRLYVTGELEQPTALFNHFHNPDKLNLGVVSLSNQATTLTFTSGIRRATIGGEGGNLVYEPTFGVYASGEVYARTYYPSSDSTLKENIQPMNLAGKARDIETFSYSWKSDTILHQTHYGFIAQQVQLHVPNLVSSRDSILAIDLTGLLALLYDDHKLLVSQVDSMNQMILSLNDQLAVCCAMNQQARLAPPQTADEQTETLTPVERLSNASKNTESQNARLDQNRPNPFGKRTEIPYFIPKGKSAKLWITDLNGKKLLSFTLEPGENTLEIKNHHLSSGIYLYNLVLDGEVVATRKMTIE
jgi:outer membrane protein assembly factor BamB